MSLFSSHEALYFVFAGEHDQYFLDSMLRLNTCTYLWMKLRESKYETVYFIGCLNQAYTVKAIDDASKKQYNGYRGKLFAKKTEIPEGKTSTQVEADNLQKWIDDCFVKGTGKTIALVFSLHAFARLYASASSKKLFNKLIERTHNGNSILLQIPMYLREEYHGLLIDPNGVFTYHTPTGASICPELPELLLAEEPIELLSRLKTRIGHRFVELSAVTYERLQSMMRCVRFKRGEDWSEDRLLEYTNCLYNWWYLSEASGKLPPDFRRMWEGLFPGLRKQGDLCASLYEKLCDEVGWKAFQDRVDVLNAGKKDKNGKTVKELFLYTLDRTKTDEKCHVMLDNVTLSNIARIPWPEELRPELVQTPSLYIPSREDWLLMQASLPAPTNKPVPRDWTGYMEKYYTHFLMAEERRDLATLCRAVNAILFGWSHLYERSVGEEHFRKYEDYLNRSREYFQIRRSLSAEPAASATEAYQMAAWQKTVAMASNYDKYLSAADLLLSGGIQQLKTPDAQEMGSLTKALEETFEPSVQEDAPMFADDVEMSVEEAEALLRKKVENMK